MLQRKIWKCLHLSFFSVLYPPPTTDLPTWTWTPTTLPRTLHQLHPTHILHMNLNMTPSYPGIQKELENQDQVRQILPKNCKIFTFCCSGTSTKYDYLSSYSSNNSYDKTPYYKSTNYASVIDTDELTKNYFEKYYNKSSSSGYSVLEREINTR